MTFWFELPGIYIDSVAPLPRTINEQGQPEFFARTGDWLNLEILGKTVHECNGVKLYNPSYDVVHVDEKWFNMYKASNRYYLASNESSPYRSCANRGT